MIAAKPGEIHYDLDPSDEQAQILAVRNAKEVADFVAFHMHVHHNRYSFQQYSHDNYPPDYLRPFLHKLIDNGLDMYFGSGNHSMQGIEITRAVPSSTTRGTWAPIWCASPILRPTPPTSPAPKAGNRRRRIYRMSHVRGLHGEYDVQGRPSRRSSHLSRGCRHRQETVVAGEHSRDAYAELARSILERIQKYSEPFGTKISIENNIGIIRVPPEATEDVGAISSSPGVSPGPGNLRRSSGS
jgi:hypothetical protein